MASSGCGRQAAIPSRLEGAEAYASHTLACDARTRLPSSKPTRALTPSQQEAVERAEAYARAHMGAPLSISELSRMVGLSERGLRNAFYSVRGMSPKRSLIAERLQAARRSLRAARNTPVTVTGVATDYGFFELGRFAATYKEAFGEAPSETLRGISRQSVR